MVHCNNMDEAVDTVEEGCPVQPGDTVEEGCPVKPGDTLVLSRPFVFAVNWEARRNVCQNCLIFKSGYNAIPLCPKCDYVGFCSPACSEAQVNNHKLECEIIIKNNKKSWPHRVWFIARAILKLKAEGDAVTERINSKKRRAFKDLVDHYDDVTTDKAFSQNKWWKEEVGELLGDLMPDDKTYMSIYGKLLVNSFALRLDNKGEEENVGTVLFLAASIFNHSCRPTATTVFSQGKLEIKAVVASDSLDLDQFHISYLDEMDSREKRQAKLSQTWYFQCACEGCQDTAPVNYALCAGCGGAVGVKVEEWTWEKCGQCGEELGLQGKDKYKEVFQLVKDVKDENAGEIKHTDVASFLVRQMTGVMHPLDKEIVQAAFMVGGGAYTPCDTSNQAIKNYATAEQFYRMALPGLRKYYRRYAGYLGNVLHQMADCLSHLDRMEEAVEAVKEAEEILSVIPGKNNYYFIHYFKPTMEAIINKAEREKRRQLMANFVKQREVQA